MQRADVFDGARNAFSHGNPRFPPQHGPRSRNVWTAHLGIVDGERLEYNRRRRIGELEHDLGNLFDRTLVRQTETTDQFWRPP